MSLADRFRKRALAGIAENPDKYAEVEDGPMSDIVWGYRSDPKPFTWAEFLRAWECACVDAWDAGKQEPTVTLPFNVFPYGTEVMNPCTGHYIPITRISPFSWDTSRCSCIRAERPGETVT